MKPVTHLDVLENDFLVVNWYVEPAVDCRRIHSDIRPFPGMNELPDYRDSGVYHIGFENQPDRLRDVNNLTGIRLVFAVLSHWKRQPDWPCGRVGYSA